MEQNKRAALVDKLTKDDAYDNFVESELKLHEEPVLRDVLAALLQKRGLSFDHAGRVVRAAIERLQEKGVPIVADPKGGFYIAKSAGEVWDESRRFRMLCEAHAHRAHVLEQIAMKMDREKLDGGQRELFP